MGGDKKEDDSAYGPIDGPDRKLKDDQCNLGRKSETAQAQRSWGGEMMLSAPCCGNANKGGPGEKAPPLRKAGGQSTPSQTQRVFERPKGATSKGPKALVEGCPGKTLPALIFKGRETLQAERSSENC